MAFSRFSRFRSRSPGRVPFTRRRAKFRQVGRVRGYEVGQFFIDEQTVIENASAAEQIVYTSLGAIPITFDASGAGDGGIRAMGQMQRALIIGGIVFNYGVYRKVGMDGGEPADDGIVWCTNQLVVDRCVQDAAGDSYPASSESYTPYINSVPIVTVGTVFPSEEAEEVARPTRIVWTNTEVIRFVPERINPDSEGVLYYPAGQEVTPPRAVKNRRLRVRLDDEQGLFFLWAFRTAAGFNVTNADNRTVGRWMRGTLYYRFQT